MDWRPPYIGYSGRDEALFVGDREVARVLERLDGGWIAMLRLDGRVKVRRCSSLAAGKAGCEAWVRRRAR